MQRANDAYQVQFEQAYEEELEHRQRVASALSAFGQAMSATTASQPTVHCTSNTIGTMTTTNCQ